MKAKWFLCLSLLLATVTARAQFFLDCSCLATQSVLITNACQAVVPDLCQSTNCFQSTVVPPPTLACSQSPAAGTPVGPGAWPITVTITDANGTAQSCALIFTVIAPSTGCSPCPTNNLVVNGSFEAGAFFVNGSGCEQLLLGSVVMPGWTVVVDEIARCQNGNFSGTTASDAVRFLDLSGYSDSPPHGGVAQTVPTTPGQIYNLSLDLGVNPSDPPLNGPITVRVTVTGSPPQLFTHNPAGLGSQWSTYGFQFAAVGPSTTITIEGFSGNAFIGLDNVTLLANCCVPPPPGMVAWWPLDELTGATLFVDATGNGHPALVESGGPVGNGGSPFAVAGNVAGANYFYGLSSRGRAVGPLLNFGTGDFSADCWVNPIPTGGIFWHPIVDKLNQTGPTTGFGYTLGLLNQYVVLKVGDGAISTYTSVGTVAYNSWGFVAVVVNRAANTVTFHVNGVTEVPQPLIPAGNFNSTVDLLIGSTHNGALPLGELAVDELELFDTILTTNELNSLWVADRFGKCKTNLCIVSMFCPSNIIATASCTQMCATVTYPAPLVTNGTLAGCTPPPGGCFPTGITFVTCTATNACGQPAVCSFSITVNAPTNCACICTITNGGFDQSVPANGTGGGWTASGVFGGAGWQPSGGNPGGTFLLNNVGDPATDPTISQTLCCLTPGQCYTIRGQRKVQAWYGVTAPSFAVLVDGATILALPVPTNPANTNWHNFAVSFTATNACQTIAFASEINGTDVSYWIDNIRIDCCIPNCRVTLKCPPNQVLLTCSTSAVAYYKTTVSGNNGPVLCTPPSGSNLPLGTNTVICTATNNCGDIATCTFTIIVKPQPNRWLCHWYAGIGIPFELVGGATMAIRPEPEDAGTLGVIGPIKPAICVFPNPANPKSGILLHPGTAQFITFTTVLDFDAPVDAGIDLVLPPGPLNTNDTPILSFRNKGAKGYCVKTAKIFEDDPSGSFRTVAVNTNGQLLDSFTFTAVENATNEPFMLAGQPGVSNCHVTVELNLSNGAVSIEFAGPVTYNVGRKGWDGCIYGPDRPIKKPTARVIFIPPPSPGVPPITDLYLYASGYAEVAVEEPTITAGGRRWGDGHVTLMKAYDDDGLEFVALGEGGGVHVDLGRSESFDLRLTKFETNGLPGEELLTRTIGPIRGLTNRPPPPPPVLDLLLLQGTPDGVACSADFSGIDSPTVSVFIYSNGMPVASRFGVYAQLGQTLLTLPDWPTGLGKLGAASPCRRITIKKGIIRLPTGSGLLAGAGILPDEFVTGDEIRVLAEPGPGARQPDYYSSFEFVASEGADWGVTELQTVSACPPAAELSIALVPDGTALEWSATGYRLLGAETVDGPWYELGVESPVSLSATSVHRFFRLACD